MRPESAICSEVSALDATKIAGNGKKAAAQLLPSMQGSHPRRKKVVAKGSALQPKDVSINAGAHFFFHLQMPSAVEGSGG